MLSTAINDSFFYKWSVLHILPVVYVQDPVDFIHFFKHCKSPETKVKLQPWMYIKKREGHMIKNGLAEVKVP